MNNMNTELFYLKIRRIIKKGRTFSMCTSIAMLTKDFYFGRNMDINYEFGESVAITPRNYPFSFRRAGNMNRHYAFIGMASVQGGFPLYAEAVNEKGLGMAGLYFEGNAYYPANEAAGKSNISPFELIPWILGKCSSVDEAKKLLGDTHIISIPFSKSIPLAPLHWHIADKNRSIVLESVKDGMKIYDNPVGVMTNNPPFSYHLENLGNYMNLTVGPPSNVFSSKAEIKPYGNGLGSFGLPGDYSPASRLVKAAYLNLNSVCGNTKDEYSSVSQYFHMLDSVSLPRGAVELCRDEYNITTYSCCMNADKGIFYYKTYYNNQITAVDMKRENLNASDVMEFPLIKTQQIAWLN